MKTLSIHQMRAELDKLDQLVKAEGELIITRWGKPIARILPVRGSRPKPSHADLRSAMSYLDTSSVLLIRKDREE